MKRPKRFGHIDSKARERKAVELHEPVNQEIEREQKSEIMRSREIVFEQRRLSAVLKDKFEHLQDSEAFEAYCDELDLPLGMRGDLEAALPRLVESLEFFDDHGWPRDVLMEQAQRFDEVYRAMGDDAKELFSHEGGGEFVQRLVQAEVDLAIKALSGSRERPVLSHRVRGFGADEASYEALENALGENLAEIEFDIRISKDGKCFIHHNATLGESADRPEYIKDLTAGELEGLELKGGEHVCSLEKFFELVRQTGNETTKINIDIKDFDTESLDEILDLIHSHGMEHRVTLVSWLPQSLQYMYEQDPSLEYSMSYFPVLRGIPRFVVETIENMPSGSLLFGAIGTLFAKMRAGAVQGVGSENIAHGTVLQANEHWEVTQGRMMARGEELTGRHTVPYSEVPVADENGDLDIMARVLHEGSVNIMALEPIVQNVVSKLEKIPMLGKLVTKHRDALVSALSAKDAYMRYAEQLQENGIKVNIFDITDDSYIDQHVDQMRETGVDPGVVYFSGRYKGLHTRDQVPDLQTE